MEDMISRERILKIFKRWKDVPDYNEAERNIIKAAIYETEYAPAVDAVEVVRCRECRYAHLTYDGEAKYCDAWAELYEQDESLYLSGDFYCAHGQRKRGR